MRSAKKKMAMSFWQDDAPDIRMDANVVLIIYTKLSFAPGSIGGVVQEQDDSSLPSATNQVTL